MFDKSVPVPAPYTANEKKFFFDKMEVGDSQLIPVTGYKNPRSAGDSVFTIANRISKRLGYRFTVRTVDDGVRIWRVA